MFIGSSKQKIPGYFLTLGKDYKSVILINIIIIINPVTSSTRGGTPVPEGD
jgi:hypothetical protein